MRNEIEMKQTNKHQHEMKIKKTNLAVSVVDESDAHHPIMMIPTIINVLY